MSGAQAAERRGMQEALFYGFNLEWRVPALGKIEGSLTGLRSSGAVLRETGRPSIDPELIPEADRRLLLRIPRAQTSVRTDSRSLPA